MKAFFENQELKQKLVTELEHHQKLDAFIQGTWITSEKIENNGFKGCFYGCTMQSEENPLEEFSEKYNIDLWYVYLTEKIFEGLPDGEYQKFPIEAIKVIPLGFDFNKIKSRFHQEILKDQLRFCDGNKKCIDAIQDCINLFSVDYSDITWSAARSAAESAARSAAWSAWSAARSAAESAAWSAAESAELNYYVFIKDLLFKCIKDLN